MAHDLGGLVLHFHHTLGMAQRHAGGKLGVSGEEGANRGLVAMQNHVHAWMPGDGIDQAGNDGCRPAIATHGVN